MGLDVSKAGRASDQPHRGMAFGPTRQAGRLEERGTLATAQRVTEWLSKAVPLIALGPFIGVVLVVAVVKGVWGWVGRGGRKKD